MRGRVTIGCKGLTILIRCGTSDLVKSGNSHFECRKCLQASKNKQVLVKTKLSIPGQRSVADLFVKLN